MEKDEENHYRWARLYFQKTADIIRQRFGTCEELLEKKTTLCVFVLLIPPKAKIIYLGNKGHKLVKEKWS